MTQTALAQEKTGMAGEVWNRLCRCSYTRRRISRKSLVRFCREMSTDGQTLVVHSVDVDHRRFFPNSFVVSKKKDSVADLHTDPYYHGLSEIGDESFGVVLCTGLLEHIPDPERLIGEFHRILKPGGQLILSASAVFPFHGAPDNFFHFTPNGLRLLFKGWARFELLRGSSQPFETIAILLQRINMQCDVFPPVRLFVELLYHVLPWLDVFVLRQYDSLARRDERSRTDSIMPATLHAVVIK
ncbi:MAG: class I SAM-dependent methyltransferase [Pyrinomonadaceae bacterium]